MRRIVVLLVLLVTWAAFTKADCNDAVFIQLARSLEVARIDLDQVNNNDDADFNFCLDTRGRQIDWYLTSTNNANVWFSRAQSFYRSSPGSFFTESPTYIERRIGTRGFDNFYVNVDEDDTDSANGRFTILLHASPECTGNGSSCGVFVSGNENSLSLSLLLLAILLPIFFCCFIVGLAVFCFFRRRNRRNAKHTAVMYGNQPAYPMQPAPVHHPVGSDPYGVAAPPPQHVYPSQGPYETAPVYHQTTQPANPGYQPGYQVPYAQQKQSHTLV